MNILAIIYNSDNSRKIIGLPSHSGSSSIYLFKSNKEKWGRASTSYLWPSAESLRHFFKVIPALKAATHLAIGSLVIHVIALSFWIGSVIALKVMPREFQNFAFSRVSVIALWSSLSVVLTGIANAWTRLRLSQDWFTGYGTLISLKIVLTLLVLLLQAE